jgi:tetratricopeptide (TPR) repeat protein
MKTRYLLIVFSVLLHITSIRAQTPYSGEIYQAYVKGDMEKWESLIQIMNNEKRESMRVDFLYELGLLKYGYIAYCIDHDMTDEAKEQIETVLEDIEDMLEIDPDFAKGYALWGAIYGFRIQLNPFRAVYLGPRSMDRIEKSIELDPETAAGWLEIANSEFYRPAIFGGDKEKSIETYKKAIHFFEKDSTSLKNNWHYLNALVALANAYEETGQLNKAVLQYEKILTIAPDFVWVRDELYPRAIKETQY